MVSLVQEVRELEGRACERLVTKIVINSCRAGNMPAIPANGTEQLGNPIRPWGYKRLAKLLDYKDCPVI